MFRDALRHHGILSFQVESSIGRSFGNKRLPGIRQISQTMLSLKTAPFGQASRSRFANVSGTASLPCKGGSLSSSKCLGSIGRRWRSWRIWNGGWYVVFFIGEHEQQVELSGGGLIVKPYFNTVEQAERKVAPLIARKKVVSSEQLVVWFILLIILLD